jgi:glycerol-1-phosphate dehydrogenase [NAD(P)+]
MSSWGYSDLAGKIPAGADWILADELGIEPIEPQSWSMVQANLPDFLSRPLDVARGDGGAIEDLFAGLAVVGFAMELHGSSRPASGADHQIAHLWEMQDLAHEGEPVSHGSCVAVGALTALKLYDWFLRLDIENLDIEAALAHYRSLSQKSDDIRDRFGTSEICSRSIEETRLKYVDRDSLRNRLSLLKACWPQLKQRLRAQILTPGAFSEKLGAAGAPTSSAAIGVDSGHLRQTVLSALYLRSRYTILDILDDIGLLKDAVGTLTAD